MGASKGFAMLPVVVMTTIPQRHYEHLCVIAIDRGNGIAGKCTVSALIREAIRFTFPLPRPRVYERNRALKRKATKRERLDAERLLDQVLAS